jgi:hypothetical protein
MDVESACRTYVFPCGSTGRRVALPHSLARVNDELPARSQYRAPGLRLVSRELFGLDGGSLGFCGGGLVGFLMWRWFGGFSHVANAVYRRWVFFPPPLSFPLPFLLFPFLPHLCVRCERFSVLPPTRAIQDHLRCLAADAGRTRAQLLGDERSGSL